MRRPFSMYKERTKEGLVWYARFWDETAQKYVVSRSTGIKVEGKRERRREAEEAATALLPTIQLSKPTGLNADRLLAEYVADFWRPESPYVEWCANVKKQPLSAWYIRNNHMSTIKHVASFPGFQGVTVRQLKVSMIRDWMAWSAKKGMSGRNINAILGAMRVAVRYLFDREELDADPFVRIKNAKQHAKEKGVLSTDEVFRILQSDRTDPMSHLAILLGVCCGMRRGEIRGLKWEDIDENVINVRHNFVDFEPIKEPKKGSKRTVPYTSSVREGFDRLKATVNPAPTDFVMASVKCPGEPIGGTFFRKALRRELEAIGIPCDWRKKDPPPEDYSDEQKRRNLTFHGLRHTFVTLGRLAGISDLEIQALAGHKSAAMMSRYSHADQVLDYSRIQHKMESAYGFQSVGGGI